MRSNERSACKSDSDKNLSTSCYKTNAKCLTSLLNQLRTAWPKTLTMFADETIVLNLTRLLVDVANLKHAFCDVDTNRYKLHCEILRLTGNRSILHWGIPMPSNHKDPRLLLYDHGWDAFIRLPTLIALRHRDPAIVSALRTRRRRAAFHQPTVDAHHPVHPFGIDGRWAMILPLPTQQAPHTTVAIS